jgi:phosphate acyltransferase
VLEGSNRPTDGARELVIAVDANGADLGPGEVAAGAALAAKRGVRVLLFGPASELAEHRHERLEVIDAPVSIAKSADPARAARSTPESSIVQAAQAVASGRAHALVCGGGTGAALAAGLFNVGRQPGIYRPALALALPVPRHPVTLLDVGANAEVRTEHLVQFAFMGAAFAQAVLDVAHPRVGLLSNGRERTRGSRLLIETLAELEQRAAQTQLFKLVGYVEGDDVVSGVADVIVTDGLTGNIVLKVTEGVSQTMIDAIKDAARSSSLAKLGGALLRPALGGFRAQLDPEGQGGAYLLGLRRLAVVPHGRFTREGFCQAILRAQQGAQQDLPARTHKALQQAGALKQVPLSARAASLPKAQ